MVVQQQQQRLQQWQPGQGLAAIAVGMTTVGCKRHHATSAPSLPGGFLAPPPPPLPPYHPMTRPPLHTHTPPCELYFPRVVTVRLKRPLPPPHSFVCTHPPHPLYAASLPLPLSPSLPLFPSPPCCLLPLRPPPPSPPPPWGSPHTRGCPPPTVRPGTPSGPAPAREAAPQSPETRTPPPPATR